VTWVTPQTGPSWLAREALAALPAAWVLREVRDHIGTPGFRTRQITLVTTLLDAESSRVADLAAWYRQRWQIDTSLAPLKTTRPMEVWHGQTVPSVLKELTGLPSSTTSCARSCGTLPCFNTSQWSGAASSMRCGGSAHRAPGAR
jgi:hypothetical protein